MEYFILNTDNSKEWESIINKFPEDCQDIYYTPQYYALQEDYSKKAECFVFTSEKNIAIYPYLKSRIDEISADDCTRDFYDIQGAYGYNGVVSSCLKQDFIRDFYYCFNDYCIKENVIAEFTRFHPVLKNYNFSKRDLTLELNRNTVFLDLKEDYDFIRNNCYSKKNRNMIRNAQNKNIEIKIAEREEDYYNFHKLYTQTMVRLNAHEFYRFKPEYFIGFFRRVGRGQLLLNAIAGGEVICSALIMIYGIFAHYHLSARTNDNYIPGTNNYILDYAIRKAKSLGCKYFHFGGGMSGQVNDPLFRFKAEFSRYIADFYIGKKVHNQNIYNQLCNTWDSKYPEIVKNKHNIFLKYREI